jgi:patatin-like phospholipase/acyl hydrolase
LDLYQSLADQVFSGLRIAGMQEYPEQPLEGMLEVHFGKIRMNPSEDSSKMFVVTKRNTETTPYLLRNYDLPSSSYNGELGWKCCDAARATSAAPTYFKPFWKNKESYTDGGIGFNNPVMLLFNETVSILSSELKENFSLLSDFPIAYIVSIGTGLMPNLPTPEPDAWALTRARAALNGTVEQVADAENAHNQMKNICERLKIPYFRFNPHFDKRIDLDNITQLEEMVQATEQYMANIDQQVNELCALISKR